MNKKKGKKQFELAKDHAPHLHGIAKMVSNTINAI